MLTKEDDVEIHALAKRGWKVSAIARHTGRDPKTVRKYLTQPAGVRRERAPSCLEPYRAYLTARFEEDKHVDATVLYRELLDIGFERSYPTLVREIRRLGLRPACLECRHRRGDGVTVEIDHPAGEEIQWDWLELHDTPWGEAAFVLIGALSHSGRFRAVFCEQMTFGYLAEAVHQVLVGLGGTARVWRTDRMATIVTPGTNRITTDAANMAKHYGVTLAVCPPNRPQRKGVVEAAVKYATKSWWRTAAVTSLAEAQQSLDCWSRGRRPTLTAGRNSRRARHGRAAQGVAGVGLPGADQRSARSVTHGTGCLRRQPLQRPAGLRRPDRDDPDAGQRTGTADPVGQRGEDRDAPSHARQRSDDPQQRTRRAAGEGGASGIHHGPCVSEQGQPATRR